MRWGVLMDYVSIKMDLPKDILAAANMSEASAPADIRKHLAIYLFKERILSFGKAAELAGVNKLEFIDTIGNKRVPLNYDSEDYYEDIATLREINL
jgi:predicted HTH domain antitoxin